MSFPSGELRLGCHRYFTCFFVPVIVYVLELIALPRSYLFR